MQKLHLSVKQMENQGDVGRLYNMEEDCSIVIPMIPTFGVYILV